MKKRSENPKKINVNTFSTRELRINSHFSIAKHFQRFFKMNTNLKLIRSLLREIRATSSEARIKDNIMVQYILEQARAHRETSETLCKAREELKHLADTYNCYLSSLRLYKQIQTDYAGVGERSVKETADLVGFKLPHDPK